MIEILCHNLTCMIKKYSSSLIPEELNHILSPYNVGSVLRGGSINTVEGYYQYCGGVASVQWRDIISTAEAL